jgi:hypothetical protein
MFSTSVLPSLNDILQSYTWILESVSSPNCALILFRISASFTFSLTRNLVVVVVVVCYATAEGATCSLVITTDKK